MEYNLKILSPVHIGCGEQLNGLNFIQDDKKVYVVEPEGVIKLLGPENGLKFAQWLEVNSNEIAKLDAEAKEKKWAEKADKDAKKKTELSEESKEVGIKLRQKRQNFTLRAFVDEKKLVTLEELKSKASYSIATQDGVFKDSEIAPFIKQARSPYIPGTEIKGSIRTAVLYCVLQDDASKQSWLKDALENFQRRNARYIDFVKNNSRLNKRQEEVKKDLTNKMATIQDKLQEEVFNSKPDDAKFDVLRFLQVGDSVLLNITSDLAVSYVAMLGKNFKIFYELLRPNLSIPLTSFKLESENVRSKKLEKMKFTKGHQRLMSGLDSILACCHRFTADLLEEEIAYFTKHGKIPIVEHLRKIQELNAPQSPVLRIGKDEGYTSLTVGLAVKKLMPKLYENVLIHATKNKSYDSSITKDKFYFPKSRKIVHWEGQELTAGWVQLIPSLSDQPAVKPSQEKTASTQSKSG